jgi:hypothetical protein
MVHLAVARQVRVVQNREPTASFFLGSLAPDAIHMRKDARPDEKHVVHLRATGDHLYHARLHELLARSWRQPAKNHDFAEGYAVHVLTDWHWFTGVFSAFCQALPDDVTPQDRRTLYYHDTDQLDFDLYHTMPWRAHVWTQLASAHPTDFETLLTAHEIHQWQQRVLHWFGELMQEPQTVPQYITEHVVRQFIHETGEAISAQLLAWEKACARMPPKDGATASSGWEHET